MHVLLQTCYKCSWLQLGEKMFPQIRLRIFDTAHIRTYKWPKDECFLFSWIKDLQLLQCFSVNLCAIG
jgi:hypothetical protein